MNTKQALANIPTYAFLHVEHLKKEYRHETSDAGYKKIVSYGAREYLTALSQAGIITQLESRLLFSYITL